MTATDLEVRFRSVQSAVFIASATWNLKKVVVKCFDPQSPEYEPCIGLFNKEINILRSCSHINIMTLLSVEMLPDNKKMMVLEYIEQYTLFDLLESSTTLISREDIISQCKYSTITHSWDSKRGTYRSLRENLHIARQLAEALRYLHEKAIPSSSIIHGGY